MEVTDKSPCPLLSFRISPPFWKAGARRKECRYVFRQRGHRAREVNSRLWAGPRRHTHTRLEHAEETAREGGPGGGRGDGVHRLGTDRLGAGCACALLWGDAFFFFSPPSLCAGGRCPSFPNSRPASFLARPQRVAVATQRPLPACDDAACLVASADLAAAAAAATVGAHGGFG